MQEARLSRFDLAADYEGFELRRDDAERVVTRGRRKDSFIAESKDTDDPSGELCKPAIREHRKAQAVTGLTIASGNPLSARLYDKTEEISLAGREEKREIEEAIWKANGWRGGAVTRVEFQLRGEVLDELENRALRDPTKLCGLLDAAWQHCVCRWARLVIPGTTRLKRGKDDPRWEVVKATVFEHASLAAKRSRAHRGGASSAHLLGVVLSRLAATGSLPAPELVTPDGEVLGGEVDFANVLSEADAAAWVHDETRFVMLRAAEDTAEQLVLKHGARGAVVALASKQRAKRARVSHVDLKASSGGES